MADTCSVDGCDNLRKYVETGWCGKHYMRVYRHGSLNPRDHNMGKENENTLPASKQPSIADIGWAAGFIEGEGSFQEGVVRACQKDPECLAQLQDLFGGRVYKRERDGTGCFGGDIWQWYVCGSRARGVAMTLYPLFSGRRQEQVIQVLGA